MTPQNYGLAETLEDPDKIQDARGLLKSTGLQTGQLE